MSYYMGDYRYGYGRGDYYRGDPGFFSFFKGLGRIVGGALGLGGGATKVITVPGMVPEAARAIERVAPGVIRMGRKVGGVIARHPVLSAAGAAGAIGAAGGAMIRGAPGAVERGFHISKRTGAVVRNRRMHVTNPRALRRALRRIGGFGRVARKVMSFTHPGRKGRLRFKFHRRKK